VISTVNGPATPSPLIQELNDDDDDDDEDLADK